MKKFKIPLVVLIGGLLIAGLVYFKIADNKTVKETLYRQQFITIDKRAHFDLKNQKYFDDDGFAATTSKSYGSDLYTYHGQEENYLLIGYLSVNATHWEVRRRGYELIYNVSSKKIWNNSGVPFSKIKIIYSHNYLPTRAYGYVKHSHKWYLYAKYSYPYHSEKQFNHDFDEMVKDIKRGDFNEE